MTEKPPTLTDAQNSDLVVEITRNLRDIRQFSVSIRDLSEFRTANPHLLVPTDYGFTQQVGPVVNNWITTVGRAADRQQALAILRREEKRLGLPNGTLKPRDDGPRF